MSQNKIQNKKLIFLRSIHTPFGGAEVSLSRLTQELSRQNIEFEIRYSSAPKFLSSWIKAWWFNWESRFKKQKNELYFSLDRLDSADIYRAGDGVHKAYLKTKSFSLNPLHFTYLILEKRCFKNSKHIICNSYLIQKEIQNYYQIPDSKISVIPNGLAPVSINPDAKNKLLQEFSIDKNLPIILFVGSGFNRKGMSEFLKLISQIKTPFHSFIIGKEKNLNFYKSEAESLNLLSKISFTGQRLDVSDFYSAADIFIFPPKYEPFGNVVLEAMAYGCVSFTNQNCGMVDFMPEKFWINKNTPSLIDDLLNNPEKLAQAKTELQTIAAQYSIEKTAQETLKIIQKFL